MVRFSASVSIDRPTDEVFAFLLDPANETRWQKDVVEARTDSGDPVNVGSTGYDIRRSMGRNMKATWQCTALEPGKMFGFKVLKPVPFSATYEFESGPAGVTVTMNAEPTGFTRLLWPLIARSGKSQYARDFAALKRVLESNGTA